ncbi:MAG: Gfo/Idh/MocA family oxidoreductase [Candidatus Sumerlaeota bacterium]|nr:Gfo/Idh/MocA family oxidoreductase [Candidatus Sumerlaeota bacterium]
MAKYRSVMIGCGPRSNAHIQAYRLLKRCEMVAAADLLPDRRERFTKKYGIKTYADAAEMIKQEKPDLVHVVTSPRVRVDVLNLVNDMGVAGCIVEKPIACGVRDWKALCALEKKAKTKIGVGAQFRYHSIMGRIRDAIASGELGKILFLEATAGYNICNQGVHVLDWAMSLNGESPVKLVFGAAAGEKEIEIAHPSPECTTAQILFENGVSCQWTLGATAPRVSIPYVEKVGNFMHCRVAAYCERGRTLFEEFNQWEIVGPNGVESGANTTRDEWQAGNDEAQANLTNSMLDWMEDSSKPVGTNFQRALQQWNAILGLYASAVLRKPMDVPFDPPDDLFEKLVAHLKGERR